MGSSAENLSEEQLVYGYIHVECNRRERKLFVCDLLLFIILIIQEE